MPAQINLLDEIMVDSFAGGGGASTGIELATGRVVDIAINHDPDAILMHKTNHPYTEHLQASVWDVDPREVCRGRPVGLAWFSPDCKHFSKAKGGKPVDRNIRGLSWVVLRWGLDAPPRVIMMENVEEIQTWGPLMMIAPGKWIPDPARKGETFGGFIGMLTTGIPADHPALAEACEFLKISTDSPEAGRLVRGLGYTVEWRELIAADYGAPTTRKRFFLIARRDNRPIVWPEPTHAPAGSEAVKAGKKKPWRSAAEIIDWSLPAPSIFASKEQIKADYGVNAIRPLAENTQRRVIRGVDKFVIKSAEPFIVSLNHTASYYQYFRGQAITDPLQTITAQHGYGLVSPSLIQYHTEQTEQVRGQGVEVPIMTVDAANRYGLVSAAMVKYYGNDEHGQNVSDPLHTVTTKDREGLVAVNLSKFYGGNYTGDGSKLTDPVHTVTPIDHNALTAVHISKFYKTGIGQRVDEPVHTITTSPGHFGAVVTRIAKAEAGASLQNWTKIRALLNEHCGYTLAEDEVILFHIRGVWYFMADIGLRMLTPRELYAANGFPADYIIDRDYLGNEYPKTKQVARCGNAVPPPFATALVRANLPEWCGVEIITMAQFGKLVAV